MDARRDWPVRGAMAGPVPVTVHVWATADQAGLRLLARRTGLVLPSELAPADPSALLCGAVARLVLRAWPSDWLGLPKTGAEVARSSKCRVFAGTAEVNPTWRVAHVSPAALLGLLRPPDGLHILLLPPAATAAQAAPALAAMDLPRSQPCPGPAVGHATDCCQCRSALAAAAPPAAVDLAAAAAPPAAVDLAAAAAPPAAPISTAAGDSGRPVPRAPSSSGSTGHATQRTRRGKRAGRRVARRAAGPAAAEGAAAEGAAAEGAAAEGAAAEGPAGRELHFCRALKPSPDGGGAGSGDSAVVGLAGVRVGSWVWAQWMALPDAPALSSDEGEEEAEEGEGGPSGRLGQRTDDGDGGSAGSDDGWQPPSVTGSGGRRRKRRRGGPGGQNATKRPRRGLAAPTVVGPVRALVTGGPLGQGGEWRSLPGWLRLRWKADGKVMESRVEADALTMLQPLPSAASGRGQAASPPAPGDGQGANAAELAEATVAEPAGTRSERRAAVVPAAADEGASPGSRAQSGVSAAAALGAGSASADGAAGAVAGALAAGAAAKSCGPARAAAVGGPAGEGGRALGMAAVMARLRASKG